MATFLRNLVSRIRSGDGQISIAAFGKHPAWGDHMPDIGLVGRLVEARQSLYLDGIRDKAISYWKSADPSQLVPFEHDLLWQRHDSLIVGRLWASADGATPPRRDFPMVLLADCTGLPLAWALKKVLPRLAKAEAACKATLSGEQVRAAVLSAEDDLRKVAAEQRPTEASSGGMSAQAAVCELARLPDFGPEHRGLLRILHVLADVDPSSPAERARAEQLRVPRAFVPSPAALELWRKFIVARFGDRIETLLLVPRGQDWIDVLVGKPDPVQFNALRASPQLIPFTTDIGYTIGPAFQATAEKFLTDCGVTDEVEPAPEMEAASPDAVASSSEKETVGEAVPPRAAEESEPSPSPVTESHGPVSEPTEVPATAAAEFAVGDGLTTEITPSPPTAQPQDKASASRGEEVHQAIDPEGLRRLQALTDGQKPVSFDDEVTRKVVLPAAAREPAPPREKPAAFGDEVTRKVVLPSAARVAPQARSDEHPPSKPAPAASRWPEPEPAAATASPQPPFRPPVKKRSRKLWIALAVFLFVLGTALMMLPKLLKPQQIAGADWKSLCNDYGVWFGPFEDSLDDPTVIKKYSADPELKKIVDALLATKQAGTAIDPRVILNRPGMSYTVLADKALENPLPEDVVARGKKANDVIAQTKVAFTKEQWPLLATADALRKRFGGETAAGKELTQIVDDVNTGPKACLTDGIDHLIENMAQIKRISQCLETLGNFGPLIEQSGDPSLKTFVKQAQTDLDAAASRSLKALATEADALDQQVGQVGAVVKNDWPNNIVRDRFLARAPASQPAGLVDRLKLWKTEVAAYRRSPLASSLRDAAEKDRHDLDAMKTDLDALKRDGAGISDQLADQVAQAQKAAEFPAVEGVTEADIPALQATAARRSALIGALREDIRVTKAMAGKGAQKVRDDLSATNEVVRQSAALNAAWVVERDALLASKLPVIDLARKAEALQARLRQLDVEMARPFVELAPLPQREWAASLKEKVGFSERDRLIAAAMKAGGWQAEKREPAFEQRWAKAVGLWGAWQAKAAALATDLATIEDRVDQLYLLDGTPKAGDKPARELYKPLAASSLLLNDDRVASAFSPVTQRVESMLAIESDPTRVLAPGTPTTEMLLAAWKKAANLSIKDGRDIEQAVLANLAKVKAERAPVVAAEVRHEAVERWAKRLTGSDAAQIAEACKAFLDEKPAEGEIALEPRARYNLTLYTAKHEPIKDDESARSAAAALDKAIAALAPLAADPAAIALRQKLAEAQAPTPPATGGPTSAGWTLIGEEKIGQDLVATYEWKGKEEGAQGTARLQFAKVPGDGKIPAFYLGTTEVSYRQFCDIIGAGGNSKGRWDLFGALLPQNPRRQGPKLWLFQNSISLSPSWSHPANGDQDTFAPSLAAPAVEGTRGGLNLLQGGTPTNPSQNHPMQYLNPPAAVYVAGVAGCRLPLAAEWKLAYQRFEKIDSNGKLRSVPNLRDANWLKQYEWLASKGNGAHALADIFTPGGDFMNDKDPYEADAKDDGFLYFAPVESDTGRIVHHLVGNVAELVVNGDRPPTVPQVRTDRDVTDYLAALAAEHGRELMVIGGSALSHPKQPVDQPFPLPKGLTSAYCDVGFRLAFTAPQASAQSKLAEALEAAPYLPAGDHAAATGK